MLPDLRPLWQRVPQSIRILSYRVLLYIGVPVYGVNASCAQQVPFGLYIKHGRKFFVPKAESFALNLVEQYTSVSAPKLVDSIALDNYNWLAMTRKPGVPFYCVAPLMPYAERTEPANDLRNCISQFRKSRTLTDLVSAVQMAALFLTIESQGTPLDHSLRSLISMI